jgi:hypothetical protein
MPVQNIGVNVMIVNKQVMFQNLHHNIYAKQATRQWIPIRQKGR